MRAIIALFFLSGLLPAQDSRTPLFVIQRSLNKNEVVYELRLKNGKIDLELPLEDYWLMHAKKGEREELTAFERTRVYGYELLQASEETVKFVLVSMRNRAIEIRRLESGAFAAIFPIQKRQAELKTVYIQLSRGGLIPRVEWIETRGRDLSTQEFLQERLSP